MNRFWSKVNKQGPVSEHRPDLGPCWLWTACTPERGYGRFSFRAKVWFAHRVAYTLTFGEIPDDKELDHLCRVKKCVRPGHLDPVTHRGNMTAPGARVGIPTGELKKAKTHCPQGHPYSGENLYVTSQGFRQCKICSQIRQRKFLKGNANKDKTHCPHGHGYDEENTSYRRSGARVCKACARLRYKPNRARYAQKER